MKPEFSEFSYGFAFSYEIVNALQPDIVGAPLFPSLVAEATVGYDVDFTPTGWPIFLQFKLADCLKTRRAKQWTYYGAPYFRMSIRKRTHSNQHTLLRGLSATEPEVYYAAPEFYRQADFNVAFVSNSIIMNSMCAPLKDLPDLTDDEQHYITYCKGEMGFHWHSEIAKHFEIPTSGRDWVERLRRLAKEPRKLGEAYFVDLRVQLVRLIKEHTEQPPLFDDELPVSLDDATPLAVFRDLRYLLLAYFGVEAFILRPHPKRNAQAE
jgi:hypothetical protein